MRTTTIVAVATVLLLSLVAVPVASAGLPPVQFPRLPSLGVDPSDAGDALDETQETIEELLG